jgi:micrococcal nuclease
VSSLPVPAQRAVLFVLLGLTLLVSNAEADRYGTVSWVYDGDTLQIKGLGKVRLLGIDTPEKETSARDAYWNRQGIDSKQLRRIARAALQFNLAQVKGKSIRLAFDEQQQDPYGRTLAYVFLPDGTLLNRMFIEKGYACVYRRFDFKRKKEFLRAEASAREQGVGVWR